MRPRGIVLGLLLVLLTVAGCVDEGALDPGEEDEGEIPDGEDEGYERCDAEAFTFERGSQVWHVAIVDCESDREGTDARGINCPRPAEAELTASTELGTGQIEVRVVDDGEELVAEHSLHDTGGQPRNLSIDEGAQAGEWELVVERRDGFEGKHRVELACPQD